MTDQSEIDVLVLRQLCSPDAYLRAEWIGASSQRLGRLCVGTHNTQYTVPMKIINSWLRAGWIEVRLTPVATWAISPIGKAINDDPEDPPLSFASMRAARKLAHGILKKEKSLG